MLAITDAVRDAVAVAIGRDVSDTRIQTALDKCERRSTLILRKRLRLIKAARDKGETGHAEEIENIQIAMAARSTKWRRNCTEGSG